MGNVMPCGGSSSTQRSPGGRGGLLAGNLSGFSSRQGSSGSLHTGHARGSGQSRAELGQSGHGSGKSQAGEQVSLSSSSLKRPLNLRHLRLRRSPKLRVIVNLNAGKTGSAAAGSGKRSSGSGGGSGGGSGSGSGASSGSSTGSGALFDSTKWALDRLGVECVHAPTGEAVLAALRAGAETSHAPCMVLVDARGGSKHHASLEQAEGVAKSVRQTIRGEMIVLVAIVKKSFLERDELVVAPLLSAGFNKILLDSSSRGYWLNELAVLLHHDVDTASKLAATETLFTALDSCRDIVQITDGEDRLVYGNQACETVLGFSRDDVTERNLWDYQNTIGLSDLVLPENNVGQFRGSELIRQKLGQAKVWEGPLNCRRKTGDYVLLDTKVVPVQVSNKNPYDHLVYIKQPPLLLRDKSLSEMYDTYPLNTLPLGSHGHKDSTGGAQNHHQHRKSFRSFRNQSCDVGSVMSGESYSLGLRRPSGAKLHSLSVEAPITKVINIILAAQENSPNYIAQALDKVLEILQTDSINLFSPEVERERKKKTDAVTTDLLGALLSQEPQPMNAAATNLSRSNSVICRQNTIIRTSSHRRRNSTRDVLYQRRSSTDTKFPHAHSGSSALTASARPSVPTLDNSTAPFDALLENSDKWSQFDILELERLTEKRCLVWLGMATLIRFEIHKTLKCSESTLQNWLTLIEANYKSSNSYHNSTHAADVLHATACFLESEKVKEYCDGLDEAACLIAAAIHDVNHPGRNSAFLCNSNAELAILYNDTTVLENHHASLGFKLSMSDDRVNIFKGLDRDSYKQIRQSVIDMVLATDMSKHFVHVNKFNSVFGRAAFKEDSDSLSVQSEKSQQQAHSGSRSPANPSQPAQQVQIVSPEMVSLSEMVVPNTPENVAILRRMIIKCADVSNPARPLKICKEWAYRIAEEYFSQTDDEKRLGLPVVMPQFDRTTCSIPKSQIGFYDFFIIDMFDMLSSFADLPELNDIIRTNYIYWKQENDKEEDEKRLVDEKLDEEDEDLEEERNASASAAASAGASSPQQEEPEPGAGTAPEKESDEDPEKVPRRSSS